VATPAAASPAAANTQKASRLRTISCPCAFSVHTARELTRKATAEISIAPRAALIRVDLTFKHRVHVAADTPESSANRMSEPGAPWLEPGREVSCASRLSRRRCLHSTLPRALHERWVSPPWGLLI
jgi:hypothetical protein